MEPLTSRNVWIASVEGGKRPIAGLTALAIAAAVLLCALLGTPALLRFWADRYPSEMLFAATPSRIFSYVTVFLPLYLCVLVSRLWERRAPLRGALMGWRGLVAGIAIGGGAFTVAVLSLAAAGVVQGPKEAQAALGAGLLIAVVLTAFQAFGEELFFRGWLQPILGAAWGVPASLIATATLFAGAHVVVQTVSLVAVLNIFLAGLVFGLLAFRTGGLVAPLGAHGTWNWLESSTLGLLPNPGIDDLGSLFDFDLTGPLLLSGGADGLNGSLAATAVLVVLAAVLWTPGLGRPETDSIR